MDEMFRTLANFAFCQTVWICNTLAAIIAAALTPIFFSAAWWQRCSTVAVSAFQQTCILWLCMQTNELIRGNGISSHQQRHHFVAVSSRARCCHAVHRRRQSGVSHRHVRQPACHWNTVFFGQISQPEERRQHLHHKPCGFWPHCYCFDQPHRRLRQVFLSVCCESRRPTMYYCSKMKLFTVVASFQTIKVSVVVYQQSESSVTEWRNSLESLVSSQLSVACFLGYFMQYN